MIRSAVPVGILLSAFFLWAPCVMAAEEPEAGPLPVFDPTIAQTPGVEPLSESPDGPSRKTGRGVTPILAPIPFKNSQLGWGAFVMVGIIHHFDADTTVKPSTGVVGGFYSDNKSWGVMAIEMARLAQDRWRLRGLFSHSEIRYNYYGTGEEAGNAGLSIGLDQPMDFAIGSALRRVTPGLYGGASVLWIRSKVSLQEDHGLPIPPPPEDLGATDLLAPGVQAEYDTRDDDYWPNHGSIASLKASFYSSALGSSRDFQRYFGTWSWYTRLKGPQVVLATNVNAYGAAGDVLFWAIPSAGAGRYGLRGYTQGRYRDNVVTTVQAELRAHTSGRWGATVFGGLARVAPSVGELTNAAGLPAGGLGIRFRLAREYPMHMRADYAWGKNEGLFYFSVGEAF